MKYIVVNKNNMRSKSSYMSYLASWLHLLDCLIHILTFGWVSTKFYTHYRVKLIRQVVKERRFESGNEL